MISIDNNKMDNRFNEKSYNKAKTVRKLIRDEMFQRSRKASMGSSYLNEYNAQTQSIIRASLQGPIPCELPPVSQATRQTISYYRRSGKPVFKTRMNPQQPHDLHMVFESLWCLAGIDDIQSYPNYQKVVKQFQDNLSTFLFTTYAEIKEMAVIAAGNKILGKQEDIMNIVNQDENQLWVLVNHIYERKISYTTMYKYLNRNLPIVYRTIYQMSNHQKDEIIQSIMKNEQLLQTILNALTCDNAQIQLYCVRIIGNILAQKEDYNQIFMKYQILDRIYPLIKSPNPEIKKDAIWMLSNYICDSGPANQILCKQMLLQKLMMLLKSEQSTQIKIQLYHVLSYLAYYGDPSKIYVSYINQNILEQCEYDMEIQNQALTLIILSLVLKLVQIGQQFANDQQYNIMDGKNPFIHKIVTSNLKKYIHSKTYSQNSSVSDVSFDIMNFVDEYQNNNDRMQDT